MANKREGREGRRKFVAALFFRDSIIYIFIGF